MLAGTLGTLVGGGGLLAVPILILLGLPPHAAIATNRLGSTGVFAAGWYKFHNKGLVDYELASKTGIPFVLGSIIGSRIMLEVDESVLRKAVAVITLVLLAAVMARSDMGLVKRLSKNRMRSVAGMFFCMLTGVYAGFYGPGFAMFLSYILILVFGQTFIESAATWKIPALLHALLTSVLFACYDLISYSAAAALFAGTFAGSYAGAHYSDRIGNVWYKRIFFTVVMIMSLKLIVW